VRTRSGLRGRPSASTTELVLGALTLLLFACFFPLALRVRQLSLGNVFPTVWLSLPFAAVTLLGVAALPVSIGAGIMRYRLYEIDRLISRTLSYTIVTGTLVGVFVGLVLLTTRVLPFSSPVGVAASTLAAAALFNPLRRRVQRLVDRRFNRARYDAEATVASFSARLRDAVQVDVVRDDLLGVVAHALEPAHLSLWIRSET
jgi:hypothetical protein